MDRSAWQSSAKPRSWRQKQLLHVIAAMAIATFSSAEHHMKRTPPSNPERRAANMPLEITNQCPETIYPGVVTQAGVGPRINGFQLATGKLLKQTVSGDWQGRVWGRTNCSFNSAGTGAANIGGSNGGGQACGTGDCNGVIDCKVTGMTPVTLAEFTLDGGDGQTYYDISLVDGYNVPMAIVMLPGSNYSLQDIPPNLTNPSCQGTATLLSAADFSPYGGSQLFLGTNDSFPLPFDTSVSDSSCSRWCPWTLQLHPPNKPGDGVYPYPDDNIQRPAFQPCYSACAKTNSPSDCCTGNYNSPNACKPGEYSKNAKSVCPDAYSFAFDDQTSTFVIPTGAGFEVVFCPGARSTNILKTEADKLKELQDTGHIGRSNGTDVPGAAPRQYVGALAGAVALASLVSLSSHNVFW